MIEQDTKEFCRASDVYRNEVSTEKAAKNPIHSQYLSDFINKVIDVKESEVLKELYVRDSLPSLLFLGNTDDVIMGERKREYPNPHKKALKIIDEFDINSPEFKLISIITGCDSRTMIILKGDEGVGKSTLIKFITDEVLKNNLNLPFICINIDLLKIFGSDKFSKVSPEKLIKAVSEAIDGTIYMLFHRLGNSFYEFLLDNPDNIPVFLQNVFGRYLEKMLKHRNDKEKFSKIIDEFGDLMLESDYRMDFNVARLLFLKHLSTKRENFKNFRRIVMVLDNADLAPIETQRMVLEIGKKFSTITDSICITPVRYWTLEKLSNDYCSEYNEIPIYIVDSGVRDISKVMEKRLRYFLKNKTKRSNLLIFGKRIDSDKAITDIVLKILNVWLTKKGKMLLQGINNNNLRDIMLCCDCILSSNEKSLPVMRLVKVLAGLLPENIPPIRKRIPFDDLLLLVGLKNRRFYDSYESYLENVFCCFRKADKEQNNMVKIRILKYLYEMKATGIEEIELEQVFEHIIIFKYSRNLIREAIKRLLRPPRRLLWSRDGYDLGDQDINRIQLGVSGNYYIEKLYKYVWYLCIIKDDAFLPCNLVKDVGFDSFSEIVKSDYYLAMIKTINFVKYLVGIEIKEISSITGEGGTNLDSYRAIYGDRSITGPIISSFKTYMNRKRDYILTSMKGDEEKYNNLNNKLNNLSKLIDEDIIARL